MSSFFPNGISSGDVTQTSAVLWTRAVDLGLLTFQIATDASFHHVVKSKKIAVTDSAVPVKVEFDHLKPGQDYFYRVIDSQGHVIKGSFETAAKLGTHEGFHFGVGGDFAAELAPYVSLKNAAGADLDLFIKLGDTIYADLIASTDFPLGYGLGDFDDDPGGTHTLAEFQAKHNDVYSSHQGANYWADLHATTPILAMIDDHEVIDNFFGGAPPSTDPLRFDQQGDFINETQLYTNGLKAFHQFNAIEDRTYSKTGTDLFDGAPDLYRYNTYGSEASIIMVDQRSFRSEEAAGGGPTFPSNPAVFAVNAFDPDRKMLGDTQFARLQQDLLDARDNGITWKFVMLPEPIQNSGVVLSPEDRYEGYAAERTALLKFIDDNHIENVVFVSSDSHWLSVNNLTWQEFPGSTKIASSAIDITTMAVGTVPIAPLLPPGLIGAPSPFGLTPGQVLAYNSLPNTQDPGDDLSLPANDKDDFVQRILNGAAFVFGGYDPIGLSSSQATLLLGDYFVGHSFGWTDFDIKATNGATWTAGDLVVTTYGVPAYTTEELANDPTVLTQTPDIVSQFQMTPTTNNMLGTPGNDDLQGTNANEVLLGAAGKDELSGGGGNDYIDGGEGKDDLFGGPGDDTIFGRDGKDKLDGQAGNDQLEGGPGGDKLDGGNGLDTASYAQATSGVTADLNKSSNNKGDAAGDKYESIENLVGSRFDDRLVGNNSANVLNGGDGDDTLIGNGGNDTLIGGTGADILNGGNGQDVLVYQSLFFAGVDLIQGFSVPNDTLAFSAAGFGGGLVAGQQLVLGTTFVSDIAPVATTPVGTGAFLYDTNDQDLSYDADGSGSGAALQLAHFDTAAALTPDDFTILA
jgi:phosphodiesterase/alkaline phosphatase D-like protein/Ca2+-binding RTX toxin-like protein